MSPLDYVGIGAFGFAVAVYLQCLRRKIRDLQACIDFDQFRIKQYQIRLGERDPVTDQPISPPCEHDWRTMIVVDRKDQSTGYSYMRCIKCMQKKDE